MNSSGRMLDSFWPGRRMQIQALRLTGAATLVSRHIKLLQAVPAGELGR